MDICLYKCRVNKLANVDTKCEFKEVEPAFGSLFTNLRGRFERRWKSSRRDQSSRKKDVARWTIKNLYT